MLGELTKEQIARVLSDEVVGRIGCHANGRTYIVPVTYVFDGENVYGQAGPGMKIEIMRANPNVCFEVEQVDNLVNWRTVVGWGTFEELSGEEADEALQMFLRRLIPLITDEHSQPSHPLDAFATHQFGPKGWTGVIYRIRLQELHGRFEKK